MTPTYQLVLEVVNGFNEPKAMAHLGRDLAEMELAGGSDDLGDDFVLAAFNDEVPYEGEDQQEDFYAESLGDFSIDYPTLIFSLTLINQEGTVWRWYFKDGKRQIVLPTEVTTTSEIIPDFDESKLEELP